MIAAISAYRNVKILLFSDMVGSKPILYGENQRSQQVCVLWVTGGEHVEWMQGNITSADLESAWAPRDAYLSWQQVDFPKRCPVEWLPPSYDTDFFHNPRKLQTRQMRLRGVGGKGHPSTPKPNKPNKDEKQAH